MALHTIPTKQLAPEVLEEGEDAGGLGSGAATVGQLLEADGAGGTSFEDIVDHKARHASGGADAFLATDLLEGVVKRIQTTTGPTILEVGAIALDETLVRGPGNTIVGSPRIAENLFLKARNETVSIIPKDKLVTPIGFDVGTGRILVDLADKDDSGKRPAVGITTEPIAASGGETDLLLSVGTAVGLNTSAFSVNDQLVLGNAGALSRPPPEVDPFTGEIQLIGQVTRVDGSDGQVFVTLSAGLLPTTAAQFFATKEITPTGAVTGGDVTRASPPSLNVAVAAGEGFVNDDTMASPFRVVWSSVSSLALTASDTNFITVDKDGVVAATVSPPNEEDVIILADAITDGSSVILLASHRVLLQERSAKAHVYAQEVIGNIVVSGLITTENAGTDLRLDVDLGTFYTHDFRVTVPATAPILFTYWHRDSFGGWTQTAGSTLIDQKWDDDSGTLVALTAGEFKKDLLFVIFTATNTVEYHVFHGQEVFSSQSEAEAGAIPAADSDVIDNGVRSGGLVVEGVVAASLALVSIVDHRPFLGQLAPGATAVTDHGLLSGLADDDHTQYLLTSGRTMTGDQNMGGNAITNVGNVDGVDVSAHAGRHENAGADEINVGGLSGALADDQPAQAHTLGGAKHTADTIANVDAKVSDATLVAEIENTTTTTTGTPFNIATIAIPDDTVVLIEVRIVARRTDSAGRATYIRHAVVFREAAGVATLEGAVDTPFTRESTGDSTWDATILVDGGNNALIEVTGQGAKTINWKSLHRTRQVS